MRPDACLVFHAEALLLPLRRDQPDLPVAESSTTSRGYGLFVGSRLGHIERVRALMTFDTPELASLKW